MKELVGIKNKKDLTGKKFGFLTVLEATSERNNGSIVWKCQCECGKICYIPTSNLSREHTRSCGCKTYQMVGEKQHLNLLGKTFGKLTVIKKLSTQNSESRWLCRCECGTEVEVIGWHLTRGRKMSCGCLISKGEEKIRKLLNESNIPFIAQASFEDCVSPLGNKLRFDFYVNNKYLIEFDGEQHYMNTPNSRYTNEDLYKIRLYDNIKNNWCKKNNIPLIRIKYNQLNSLTINDLILKE